MCVPPCPASAYEFKGGGEAKIFRSWDHCRAYLCLYEVTLISYLSRQVTQSSPKWVGQEEKPCLRGNGSLLTSTLLLRRLYGVTEGPRIFFFSQSHSVSHFAVVLPLPCGRTLFSFPLSTEVFINCSTAVWCCLPRQNTFIGQLLLPGLLVFLKLDVFMYCTLLQTKRTWLSPWRPTPGLPEHTGHCFALTLRLDCGKGCAAPTYFIRKGLPSQQRTQRIKPNCSLTSRQPSPSRKQ